MSITSGALSKTFVVVSDTAPASPFEGQLWRDTQNDVLKQWDGSSWVSVQSSPDGTTIVKNSNGELTVGGIITQIIGDFESNFGTWSKFGTTSTITRGTSDGYNGSTSIYIRLDDSDTTFTGLQRTFNMDGKQEISVYGKHIAYDGSFRVDVGGTTELDYDQSNNDGTYEQFTIDVSSYSGDQTVKIGCTGRWRYDYITLTGNTTTQSNGAGGTA